MMKTSDDDESVRSEMREEERRLSWAVVAVGRRWVLLA